MKNILGYIITIITIGLLYLHGETVLPPYVTSTALLLYRIQLVIWVPTCLLILVVSTLSTVDEFKKVFKDNSDSALSSFKSIAKANRPAWFKWMTRFLFVMCFIKMESYVWVVIYIGIIILWVITHQVIKTWVENIEEKYYESKIDEEN